MDISMIKGRAIAYPACLFITIFLKLSNKLTVLQRLFLSAFHPGLGNVQELQNRLQDHKEALS